MSARIFVGELLQEHFDEVAFLIGERQNALCSSLYTSADLRQLDERIAANLDGLRVGAEKARQLALKFLKAEEAETVCAAAMFLLGERDQGASQAVVDTLEKAKDEPVVAGICIALRKGPIDLVADKLRTLFDAAPARVSAAAAEALASHGLLDPGAQRLAQMLSDKNPLVRRAAWRATALAS